MRRVLGRVGFVALGAVYIALGALAVRVALEGSKARGRVGGFAAAFRFLLSQPHGPLVLGLIAAGLAAFTASRLADASSRSLSIAARVFAFVDAVGHAALAWIAVRLILRIRRGFDSRSALGWVLAHEWGPGLLTAAGIAVLAVGAVQVAQGFTGRLRLRPSPGRLGKTATSVAIRVGRFGYFSRGIVTAIIGWFLFRAARDVDPRRYHDLGGALEVLERMRFGSVLLAAAGMGLVAYGAYLVLLAFFSRKTSGR